METTTINTELVSRYLDTWNETDAERRLEAVAALWEEAGTYTDPMFSVAGVVQIDDLIGGFQQQYPGLLFVHTGDVESHHSFARFTWDLKLPTGDVIAKGMDVASVAANGRLLEIVGFFDQAPVLG